MFVAELWKHAPISQGSDSYFSMNASCSFYCCNPDEWNSVMQFDVCCNDEVVSKNHLQEELSTQVGWSSESGREAANLSSPRSTKVFVLHRLHAMKPKIASKDGLGQAMKFWALSLPLCWGVAAELIFSPEVSWHCTCIRTQPSVRELFILGKNYSWVALKSNIYGKKKSVMGEKSGKDLLCMWCFNYTLHSFGAALNYELLPAVGYNVL